MILFFCIDKARRCTRQPLLPLFCCKISPPPLFPRNVQCRSPLRLNFFSVPFPFTHSFALKFCITYELDFPRTNFCAFASEIPDNCMGNWRVEQKLSNPRPHVSATRKVSPEYFSIPPFISGFKVTRSRANGLISDIFSPLAIREFRLRPYKFRPIFMGRTPLGTKLEKSSRFWEVSPALTTYISRGWKIEMSRFFLLSSSFPCLIM